MVNKYFKVKTSYLKKDENSKNGTSTVSEIRLFLAIDYMDAQKQAIEIINKKGCCGSCDLDIQKVSYDSCLYKTSEKRDEELIFWYEIKITRLELNDKDEEKYITSKYLVEGTDLEDSIDTMREYLKHEDENYWWFTSIVETPIQEVYLNNN